MSGMRGKCLNMLHVYEDSLWALGDKSIKPPLILPQAPTPTKTEEDKEVEKEGSDEKQEDNETSSADDKKELGEEEKKDQLADNEKKMDELKLDDKEEAVDESELNEEEEKKDDIDHEKLLLDSFLTAAKFKSKEFKLPVIVSTFMKIMQTCW